MYRLLDAVVTFHSELARPGQVIRYDIRILHFFQQGDTWLFRFQFDATVDGQPLLTMREGTAGFFSQAELDAGKGIVQSAIEQQEQAGLRPDDWRELVPMRKHALDEGRLEALRAGDLVGAFGEEFSGLGVERPLTIPGGRMRLVHRVTELDPDGGRYGIGGIVATAVANKLADVAARHQVFVVTHLAQVASRASGHLLVEKSQNVLGTATTVTALTGERRVEEIARMLGGDPESTASREHARELLGA